MTNRTRPSLSLVAAAALLLGLAGPALAQADGPTPSPPAARRVKVINIEEEKVIGDVPTGQIIPMGFRTFSKHPSLIRVRHSFVDKILSSADGV